MPDMPFLENVLPAAIVRFAAVLRRKLHDARAIVPGLIVVGGIAGSAILLRRIPGLTILSPMILSTLLGMVIRNTVRIPRMVTPGVTFSLKRILRLGIILLGFQLMISQVIQVGLLGCGVIIATLVATFAFTKWLGNLIGVDAKLVELIAAGTSICGASAIIATNTVTRGSDEDVAYAIACVTIFGSLAMFIDPLAPEIAHLTPKAYGLWAGASIHEIAQVVAAAFQDGPQAGQFGAVAKLTRVMMLAPLVISLGAIATRRARRAAGTQESISLPVPWFVLGFVALIAVNSALNIPAPVKANIATLTTFLLSMALAAMGLETDLRKLRAKGWKPLGLAAGASVFIAAFSLALIKLSAYS